MDQGASVLLVNFAGCIGQDGTREEQRSQVGTDHPRGRRVLAALGVLMFSLGVNNVTPLNEGTLVIFGVLAVVLGFITPRSPGRADGRAGPQAHVLGSGWVRSN